MSVSFGPVVGQAIVHLWWDCGPITFMLASPVRFIEVRFIGSWEGYGNHQV